MILATTSFSGTNQEFPTENRRSRLAADPIVIVDDADYLARFAGGIRDIEISSPGPNGRGIEINDVVSTTVVIEDVYVHGMTECGIWMSNVLSANIINVTCTDNVDAGLRLDGCSSIDISLSEFSNNYYGVDFQDSDSCNLENSTCDSNSIYGVRLASTSGSNTLKYNTFQSLESSIDARDDDASGTNTFLNNFYSHYEVVDEERDGKGDEPFPIMGSAGNEDSQPMALPPDRPPVSWNVLPTDKIHEYGTPFYYTLDAIIYGGLSGWTINNSAFSIDDEGVITETEWLPVGKYELEVKVSNLYNDELIAEFKIEVEDSVYPEWIYPSQGAEIPAELGEAFTIQVEAYDLASPLLYFILNTQNFTIDSALGTITNNMTLDMVRNETLNVWVRDLNNNFKLLTFDIVIRDTTAPTWVTAPSDVALEFNMDVEFDLEATDLSGIAEYGIDDTEHFSIDVNGTITNSSSLAVGRYPVTVWALDSYSNQKDKSLTIEIQDTTAPQWIIRPTIHQVEFGEGLDIQVEAWDATGVSYYVISDPVIFDVTAAGRILSFKPLEKRTYSLTLTCYDLYGNYVSTPFTVVVQDRNAPEWTYTPSDLVVELDTQLNVQLYASDPSGLANWSVDETEWFSIDSDGVLSNVTNLRVRSYPVHVRVSDVEEHILVGIFDIIVVDSTPPLWRMIQRNFNVTFPTPFTVQLMTYDLSGVDRWTTNNTLFTIDSNGVLSSGVIGPGLYMVDVTAYDPYDNSATIQLLVRVELVDTGFFLITGSIGVFFLSSIALIVLMFDPKYGRIGFAKGGGA